MQELLISVFSRWKDSMNQLIAKVRDCNMYETKLQKSDGSVLAANEDDGRCEYDATALQEDRGDDPKDGSSGPESSEGSGDDGGRCEGDATALREDGGDDPKDGSSGPESSEDNDDWQDGHRVVQILAISANFPICTINGYDYRHGMCIYDYEHSVREVQEVHSGSLYYTPSMPNYKAITYFETNFNL
jgi:hypothetical protein